jgi:hypothetical protein
LVLRAKASRGAARSLVAAGAYPRRPIPGIETGCAT